MSDNVLRMFANVENSVDYWKERFRLEEEEYLLVKKENEILKKQLRALAIPLVLLTPPCTKFRDESCPQPNSIFDREVCYKCKIDWAREHVKEVGDEKN